MFRIMSLFLFISAVFAQAAELQFFAFDNGVGRGTLSPVEQATLLKETGYDGIGYTAATTLAERQQAFDAAGLTIFSLYVACRLGKTPTCDAGIIEVLPLLKKRPTVLWLTVQGKGDDDAAVAAIRLVAEPAAKLEIPVVLYPHFGFRIATLEQALAIREKVGLANVGVSFNLCHELRAGNEKRFENILKSSAPFLRLVSINGAEHEGNWDKLIKPLGDGAYDVRQILRWLKDINYTGPIGLQCYNVPGDFRKNLKRSMATWKQYQQELQTAGEQP